MRAYIKPLIIASFITLFMFSDAFAYLDPGSGSFILQMLIAGIASALLAVKIFWKKIVDFFKNLFTPKKGKEK